MGIWRRKPISASRRWFARAAWVDPGAVVALEKAFMAAVQQPQVQSQLQRAGLEPTGTDAASAARKLREERDFWRPIVEASGFKSEE